MRVILVILAMVGSLWITAAWAGFGTGKMPRTLIDWFERPTGSGRN